MTGPESALGPFWHGLGAQPAVDRVVLGLSGGIDSMALLHALAYTRPPNISLAAIHVHHGLSANADDWAGFVDSACQALGVELTISRVVVGREGSVETAARQARYAAFSKVMGAGDVLVLAHHCDDQAETLLFRLLRGAGVRGLAAMRSGMPDARRDMRVYRPWLTVSRQQILDYARAKQLVWIEDESNADDRHARNFLRNRVFPQLRQHWPEVSATLASTAGRMAEADSLLEEYAQLLLAPSRSSGAGVSVTGLRQLSPAQQRLVLRHLITESGLALPMAAVLEQILSGVLPAASDATPHVSWHGGECRRYRDQLFLLAPCVELPSDWRVRWQGEPLMLPDGRCLSVRSWPWANQDVWVTFRQGGERIRPVGRAHRKDLKTLLQEAGVPPWERSRIPLVWLGEVLVAVVGYWTGEEAASSTFELKSAPGNP